MPVKRAPSSREANHVDPSEESLSVSFIPQIPHARLRPEPRRQAGRVAASRNHLRIAARIELFEDLATHKPAGANDQHLRLLRFEHRWSMKTDDRLSILGSGFGEEGADGVRRATGRGHGAEWTLSSAYNRFGSGIYLGRPVIPKDARSVKVSARELVVLLQEIDPQVLRQAKRSSAKQDPSLQTARGE